MCTFFRVIILPQKNCISTYCLGIRILVPRFFQKFFQIFEIWIFRNNTSPRRIRACRGFRSANNIGEIWSHFWFPLLTRYTLVTISDKVRWKELRVFLLTSSPRPVAPVLAYDHGTLEILSRGKVKGVAALLFARPRLCVARTIIARTVISAISEPALQPLTSVNREKEKSTGEASSCTGGPRVYARSVNRWSSDSLFADFELFACPRFFTSSRKHGERNSTIRDSDAAVSSCSYRGWDSRSRGNEDLARFAKPRPCEKMTD